MARRLVRAGDIFSLPLGGNSAALCRVVFTSTYFKQVILISVHGPIDFARAPEMQARDPALVMLYCSSASLSKGDWAWLTSSPTTAEDRAHTRRIVGGSVWLGDEHLGLPQEADLELRRMDVHGDRVLVRKVSRVLGA